MGITSPDICPLGKTYFYDEFESQNPTKWSGTQTIGGGYLYDTGNAWLIFSDTPQPNQDESVEVQFNLNYKWNQNSYNGYDSPVFILGDNTKVGDYAEIKWVQNPNIGDPAVNFKYDLILSTPGGDQLLFRNEENNNTTDMWVKLRVYADQLFVYLDYKFVWKIVLPQGIAWQYALWAETVSFEYSRFENFYIVGGGLDNACAGLGGRTRMNLETQARNLTDVNIAPHAHIAYDKLNIKGKIQSEDLSIGELHASEDTTVLENKKIVIFARLENVQTGAPATSTDVSAQFSGDTPVSEASNDEGIIIDGDLNRVAIFDDSTGGFVNDGSGGAVYGRLTEAAGVWTLAYYKSDTSPYEFTSDTTIDFVVSRRTNLLNVPEDFLTEVGISGGGGGGGSLELQEHITDPEAHTAESITVAHVPVRYTAATNKVEAHITGLDNALAVAGGEGAVGTPTDGAWDDGLLNIAPTTKVKDALDEMNEVFAELAPSAPDPLEGSDLDIYASSTTLYAGYLSDGNTNYEGSAGDYVNYIVKDATFQLETLSTAFSYADLGTLGVRINGIQVDTFNLAAAFVEGERDGDQTYTPAMAGNGILEVVEVGKYNNFKKWQKGLARVHITPAQLQQGYNYITVVHQYGAATDITNEWKLFYDTDSSSPTVTVPTFAEAVLSSSKYLSGIRFYSIGDQFYFTVTGNGLFDNVYVPGPINYSLTGLGSAVIPFTDAAVTPPLNDPPSVGDTMNVVNKLLTIAQANQATSNLRISSYPLDPYGTYASQQSVSQSMMLNTYSDTYSSNTVEYFQDEDYRLPDDDGNPYPDNYDGIPSLTGNWDSTVIIPNSINEAQVFNGTLVYPSVDYTVGYLPSQSADYSAFNGDKHFLRAFYKSSPFNAGVLRLTGFVLADILASGDAKVEIKLPTQTGWLDLGEPFNSGTFTGANGDGCRTSDSGSDFGFSAGSFTTAASGGMIVVRVTLKDVATPKSLTRMQLL